MTQISQGLQVIRSAVSRVGVLGMYHLAVYWCFSGYVAAVYDYWFPYRDMVSASALLAFPVSMLMPFVCISKRIVVPSDVLAWLFYFLVAVPTVVVSPFLGVSVEVSLTASMLVLFATALIGLCGRVPLPVLPKGLHLIGGATPIILVFSAVLLISIIAQTYSFNLGRLISLEIFADVYGVRGEFRDTKAEASGIAGYSIYWMAKVICPGLVAFGLARGRLLWIAIGFLAQIAIFSISAHKSFLLTVLLVFAVHQVYSRRATIWQVCGGAAFLIAASMVLFGVGIHSLANIVRRAVVVPGILSTYWVDYFKVNDNAWFSGSRLGKIFDGPYDVPPAMLMGEYYFNRDWTSANVNFAVDAYGNAGLLGVFVLLFSLSAILVVVNRAAKAGLTDGTFFVGFVVPVYWSLVETSMISTLVTHGLIFVFVLALLWRPLPMLSTDRHSTPARGSHLVKAGE